MTDFIDLKAAELQQAHDGSFYAILGTGGDLETWVKGYTDLLEHKGIGTPASWYRTTGFEVNTYVARAKSEDDWFGNDLTILLFPLEDLKVGKLAMFKLAMGDRWFSDIVDNMRRE